MVDSELAKKSVGELWNMIEERDETIARLREALGWISTLSGETCVHAGHTLDEIYAVAQTALAVLCQTDRSQRQDQSRYEPVAGRSAGAAVAESRKARRAMKVVKCTAFNGNDYYLPADHEAERLISILHKNVKKLWSKTPLLTLTELEMTPEEYAAIPVTNDSVEMMQESEAGND